MSEPLPRQPECNIGTAGHVDHGKTTLIQGLTGIWVARHSEELRRGITIRLGYADCGLYRCSNHPPPECYTTKPRCPLCGEKTEFLRAVSFVDCPGHEILMTTMLSGASVMDGAILVIAANEPVPKPQTREHMAALEIIGVKNIVVVQNKVDLVSREQAEENFKAIKKFLEGTIAQDAPVIPVSAQHAVNLDLLIEAVERFIPTPTRDPSKPPLMHIVRSFDTNKPGTRIEDLRGGVLGGTIIEGKLRVGDEIEIKPGVRVEREGSYEPLHTEVVSLRAGGRSVEVSGCGGLVGVGTLLDPAFTKADGLIGNLLGKPGTLPETLKQIEIEVNLFKYAIGTPELVEVEPLKTNEPVVINSGTSVTAGVITSSRAGYVEVSLRKPVCAGKGARVALSRRIAGRWRLVGYGILR